MKLRPTLAAGVAAIAAFALVACSSSSSDGSPSDDPSASGTLTVWLQTDAQAGWPEAVAAATAAVKNKYPNVTVKVEYQQWGDHLTKLDAALAGSTPPDVVELGNTETTKYMAAGALADITSEKSTFDNSSTWLQGLADSSTYNDALFAVPYYAGSRAVINNASLYRQAGITSAPKTYDEFLSNNDALMSKFGSDPAFSAFYLPGKYWYAAMAWVYDQGGAIATQSDGTWTGTLDSEEAQAGLTAVKEVVDSYSRADKTGDEAKQDAVMAQGNVAAIYGNGWERGVITDPTSGDPDMKLDAYPLPSLASSGSTMPAFLGGSDLAITAKSEARPWALAWIQAFTSTESMTQLIAKGVLPNNTTQLGQVPAADQAFAKSAQNSWFVPTSPNWAQVETANVIPNMLVAIYTGSKTVAQASADASEEITTILNGS